MPGKTKRTLLVISMCLLLASCSTFGQPSPSAMEPSPAVTLPATPEPATPSPTPSPTPTPLPTPSPTPTPTPDPWAAHFTASGAWVTVPDPDNGPWIYKDTTLSVEITKLKLGKRVYFRAEIYTRGPLPQGSFAYNDPKAGKKALPYLIARQNKAVFAITGDYVKNNRPIAGVMIRQGNVFSDKRRRPTMAVMPDGNLNVYDPGKITAAQLQTLKVKDAFSFGPILVQNGKIHPTVLSHSLYAGSSIWTGNWRSAIGQIEPKHYICIVAINGITMKELAQLFVDNHCKTAFNLDGGHSSTIVFMGEQLYKQAPGQDNGQQRSLSDLLTIGTNDAVPGIKDPVYCNGLHYNPKFRPKPTDGPLN